MACQGWDIFSLIFLLLNKLLSRRLRRPKLINALDDNAVAVLKLVDGTSSVSQIARTLGETYDADPAVIEADILVMLAGLAQKRVLER